MRRAGLLSVGSERWRRADRHGLARDGVDEGDGLRMQVEAVAAMTIKRVAEDGTAETAAVGAVYAQLMGASRERMQLHAVVAGHAVSGVGVLAFGVVYPLSRTVIGIGRQSQPYLALGSHGGARRLEPRHIGLVYLAAGKLALQPVVDLGGERHYHQSAGVHVEPVYHHRSRGMRMTPAHDGCHRLALLSARHAQHASRLVYHHEPLVFIDDVQPMVVGRVAAVFHLYSLQHVAQHGPALALASRVVMQVMAYLSLGTLAPPEHRYAQRAQAHPVGILQQLGLATFARAARWGEVGTLRVVVGKDVGDGSLFATAVAHHKAVEEPVLQAVAHLASLGDEPLSLFALPLLSAVYRADDHGPPLSDAAQLRLLVLALADESARRLFIGGGAQQVAAPLGLLHRLAPSLHTAVATGFNHLAALSDEAAIVGIHGLEAVVDGAYLPLGLLEVSGGREIVVDRRYKVVGERIAAAQLSAVSLQIAQVVAPPYHQHAKHLAPLFGVSAHDFRQTALQFAGSGDAQRMGLVTEWVVHARGWRNGSIEYMK